MAKAYYSTVFERPAPERVVADMRAFRDRVLVRT